MRGLFSCLQWALVGLYLAFTQTVDCSSTCTGFCKFIRLWKRQTETAGTLMVQNAKVACNNLVLQHSARRDVDRVVLLRNDNYRALCMRQIRECRHGMTKLKAYSQRHVLAKAHVSRHGEVVQLQYARHILKTRQKVL